MSIAALILRLSDIEGIETLSLGMLGLKPAFRWGEGYVATVDPLATDKQIETAIRNAARLPPVSLIPDKPRARFMSNFAAQIKAVMDQAKAGVAQAQADGLAKVNAAVGKLNDAAKHTAAVTDQMAASIQEQADSVLAELGQISNFPPADEPIADVPATGIPGKYPSYP